jgi:hypothetical protein
LEDIFRAANVKESTWASWIVTIGYGELDTTRHDDKPLVREDGKACLTRDALDLHPSLIIFQAGLFQTVGRPFPLQLPRVKVLGGLALFGGKLSSIVPEHIFRFLMV